MVISDIFTSETLKNIYNVEMLYTNYLQSNGSKKQWKISVLYLQILIDFFDLDFSLEVHLGIGIFGVNNVSAIILQISFFLAVVLHALVPASVDQSLF